MRMVYIDESGNLGTMGRYFVLAAIVFNDAKASNRIKRIMRKACKNFAEAGCRPLEEIHSTKLTFQQKQTLLNKFASKSDHEIFILVADKNHIAFQLSNVNRNIGYNYLAGLLVKSIVRKYDDDLCFVFDGRSTKITSRDSLLYYLSARASFDWGYKHKLDLSQSDSRQAYCLQATDLISNVTYRAFRDNKHHLSQIVQPHIEDIIKFPHTKFGK